MAYQMMGREQFNQLILEHLTHGFRRVTVRKADEIFNKYDRYIEHSRIMSKEPKHVVSEIRSKENDNG
jgi:hypothetical protein